MSSDQQQKHLNAINKSIDELRKFQDRTRSPKPIPHQYVGTVIDSTVGLLCSCANSLDRGGRTIIFSDFDNWLSLMKITHRSFYSNLHVAVELGIKHLCKERNLSPESSVGKRFLNKIAKIKCTEKEIRALQKYFSMLEPSFIDHVNILLKHSSLSIERKKIWRQYFNALTILRNKASHSNSRLTNNQSDCLLEGGFSVMVSRNNELQMNTRQYSQLASHILEFFDEII